MNTVLSCETLIQLLDTTIQEVIKATTGIQVSRSNDTPQKDICTVYISFQKGFSSSLALYAEKAMLERMARNALQIEIATPRDVEDYAKEFFNILCGQITAAMFNAAKTASRFSVPAFYRGYYVPDDMEPQFAIDYTSSHNEGFQFVHYICKPLSTHLTEKEI